MNIPDTDVWCGHVNDDDVGESFEVYHCKSELSRLMFYACLYLRTFSLCFV